jgi:hypothetical protein
MVSHQTQGKRAPTRNWDHGRVRGQKRGGAKTSKDLLRKTFNIDDTKDSSRFLGHDANSIVLYLLYKLQSVELLTTIQLRKTERVRANTQHNDREPFIKLGSHTLVLGVMVRYLENLLSKHSQAIASLQSCLINEPPGHETPNPKLKNHLIN